MVGYLPYMAATIVIFSYHLIFFVLAVLFGFKFYSLNRLWNKIYAFENKDTKNFVKYLVQLDIFHMGVSDLEDMSITVKFMESLGLVVYPIRIPQTFYRNNVYNHHYKNGHRIQFLFIRNAQMGRILNVSLNHDLPGCVIKMGSVLIQDLSQNDCYIAKIDKPVQCLPVEEADKQQAFDMLKVVNDVPPSEFSARSDNDCFLLLGPFNLLMASVVFANWTWCKTNVIGFYARQRSYQYIYPESWKYAAGQSLGAFFLIITAGQSLFVIVNKYYSGRPRGASQIVLYAISILFFVAGEILAFKVYIEMSPNNVYLTDESVANVAFNIFAQMAFVSLGIVMLFALPLRYLLNLVVAEWLFINDNQFQIAPIECTKQKVE